jgi:hypothetical protein
VFIFVEDWHYTRPWEGKLPDNVLYLLRKFYKRKSFVFRGDYFGG